MTAVSTAAANTHVHLFEWLEIDWGLYVWVCTCGEIEL